MTTTPQKRRKRLNIYNTDRHFNFNLVEKDEINSKIKITRENEDDIEKSLDLVAGKSKKFKLRDDKDYLIYQEKYNNDKLIKKVINHGGSVSYYTDTIVPYYVLTQLSMNTKSEVIYALRAKFKKEEVENINLSYMGTTVTIDAPVVIPDISPYALLFALHPLKTNVDRVQLSFPSLTGREVRGRHKKYYHKVGKHWEVKPEIKYEYFKFIQDSLSIWGMNIWIVCDSKTDLDTLITLADVDFKKRSTSSNVTLRGYF